MQRSPPQHRHDGTSPLPLGMDWSPPPRKWNGRDTQWPHDHRTGWSYCVTIPSWVVLPKSRDSDPIVFYRVQVGVQSPEGITTITFVLRRFNDFLKLATNLRKLFPKKNLPPAPPKGLLRMKSRVLLDERKSLLEQWMTQLLSDLDLSRSVPVAAFLELETAARSAFQDLNLQQKDTISSNIGSRTLAPGSVHASSCPPRGNSLMASDSGSDTAYEASENSRRDDIFESGVEDLSLDEDFSSPIENLLKYGMSNIDEGLFMGKTILDQLEGMPRNKVGVRYGDNVVYKDTYDGNSSKPVHARNGIITVSEPGRLNIHSRKLSSESNESDVSSLYSGTQNISGDGSVEIMAGAEMLETADISNGFGEHSSGEVQILLPVDQKQKMNRILLTTQQRLTTAKTDMMDLISRLNQEVAVKDYLSTKVKDLEVELLAIKQKSKENLQQAIIIEREKLTRMQWDMEELRRKSMEMELKLKFNENASSLIDHTASTSSRETETLSQELEDARERLENMSKQYDQLESRSKSEIKLLAKEFKSLKLSQSELKKEHSRLQEEKSEIEKQLIQEKEVRDMEKHALDTLLQDCAVLCHRLQESKLEDSPSVSSPLEFAKDVLNTSEKANHAISEFMELNDTSSNNELRTLLHTIFLQNSELMKRFSSVTRLTLVDQASQGE